MTNSLRTGKIHHAIKFGKPSISIRAIYTMAMLNNQRVDHGLPILPWFIDLSSTDKKYFSIRLGENSMIWLGHLLNVG